MSPNVYLAMKLVELDRVVLEKKSRELWKYTSLHRRHSSTCDPGSKQ
ncbi:hypothetical protein [Alicyclobacillus dauci]|uniref:Uncharacterized protein n=1 Tax=Alicyclobacillus dauci TaxID=1475485 RepID=A0ABY6Z362_9BACL|nr:hypothetical protein [Alicyclobacillus dauci]WAH37195.1 hypothetical protein NZD86_01190 [Alicyclobacillus dauci]